MKNYISTQEASKKWNMSERHIRRLCETEKIKAEKVGSTWMVNINQNLNKGKTNINEELLYQTVNDYIDIAVEQYMVENITDITLAQISLNSLPRLSKFINNYLKFIAIEVNERAKAKVDSNSFKIKKYSLNVKNTLENEIEELSDFYAYQVNEGYECIEEVDAIVQTQAIWHEIEHRIGNKFSRVRKEIKAILTNRTESEMQKYYNYIVS